MTIDISSKALAKLKAKPATIHRLFEGDFVVALIDALEEARAVLREIAEGPSHDEFDQAIFKYANIDGRGVYNGDAMVEAVKAAFKVKVEKARAALKETP